MFIVAYRPVLAYISAETVALLLIRLQKKKKKRSFSFDLLSASNGVNRSGIMHRFMANQIPTEQRFSEEQLSNWRTISETVDYSLKLKIIFWADF